MNGYSPSAITLSAVLKSVMSVKARNPTTKRHAITFITAVMVIASPIFTVINTASVQAAPLLGESGKVDTSSYHSSFPVSETSSTSTNIPSSLSSTPTTQAALTPPASFLSSDIVGSKAIYEIVFVTTTTGTIKKIEITFPAGTDISGAGIIERIGIGHGTLTKAGTTVTLNVQSPVSVPAGTYIRLEMVNIKNPQSPSSNYKVTVTTKNDMMPPNVIDGPTQSTAYNIKQIGTADIADKAVTSPKIASGAVTPEKIAPASLAPFVNQREGSLVVVDPSSFGFAVADCLAGEKILGGGYHIPGSISDVSAMSLASEGVSANRWLVEMVNEDSVSSHPFRARAECMPALP